MSPCPLGRTTLQAPPCPLNSCRPLRMLLAEQAPPSLPLAGFPGLFCGPVWNEPGEIAGLLASALTGSPCPLFVENALGVPVATRVLRAPALEIGSRPVVQGSWRKQSIP